MQSETLSLSTRTGKRVRGQHTARDAAGAREAATMPHHVSYHTLRLKDGCVLATRMLHSLTACRWAPSLALVFCSRSLDALGGCWSVWFTEMARAASCVHTTRSTSFVHPNGSISVVVFSRSKEFELFHGSSDQVRALRGASAAAALLSQAARVVRAAGGGLVGLWRIERLKWSYTEVCYRRIVTRVNCMNSPAFCRCHPTITSTQALSQEVQRCG